MRRKYLSILLLSLLTISGLAVAFTRLAPASAARAAEVTIFTSHFKDLSATAAFETFSGCVDTFVSVGADASTAGLFIAQFDICSSTLVLEASGQTANPTLQVDQRLLAASLNATIPVYDLVSNTTSSVSVSLTWTGGSFRMSEDSIFRARGPGVIENVHFLGDFRPAVASGTVSDGATNFTPDPSGFAQIAKFASGNVTIITDPGIRN